MSIIDEAVFFLIAGILVAFGLVVGGAWAAMNLQTWYYKWKETGFKRVEDDDS